MQHTFHSQYYWLLTPLSIYANRVKTSVSAFHIIGSTLWSPDPKPNSASGVPFICLKAYYCFIHLDYNYQTEAKLGPALHPQAWSMAARAPPPQPGHLPGHEDRLRPARYRVDTATIVTVPSSPPTGLYGQPRLLKWHCLTRELALLHPSESLRSLS